MDFKIELPNYGNQRQKWVTENTHFLLAYSGISRMKALNKLLR